MTDHKHGGGFRGQRGGFGGSRGSFGGRPSFRDDGDRKEMFAATCSSCHKPCEVPFRPTGDRPVYCRDCFRREMPQGDRRDDQRDDRRQAQAPRPFERRFAPAYSSKSLGDDNRFLEIQKLLVAVNTKLDRLLKVIEPAPLKVEEKRAAGALDLSQAVSNARATAKPEKKRKVKSAKKG